MAVHLHSLGPAFLQASGVKMDYKELILQYADSLKTDLTWASKTHINMLTMLAAENKAAAASICATIERHVLSVGLSCIHCRLGFAAESGRNFTFCPHVCRLLLQESFLPFTWWTAFSKM